MPATAQERWFARLYLLLPMIVGTLALFWILSGLIGLARFAAAREVLTSRGMSAGAAGLLVGGGALVDLALGAGVLVRRYARSAAVGMVAVSLTYLVGGTILAPDLLVDPLGPLVKILPALTLGVIGAALLDER